MVDKSARDIVLELFDKNIYIYYENGSLRTKADAGLITEYEAGIIKGNRERLVNYFLSMNKTKTVELPKISRRSKKRANLSFEQEGLWFIDQFGEGSAQFNVSSALHIKGKLDEYALENSLNEIICRHESLRTIFADQGAGPNQIVQEAYSLNLVKTDLSGLSDDCQASQLETLIEREANKKFDLSKDLMIRASLFSLSKDEFVFLVTIHHIVSDAWSSKVFIRELCHLYKQKLGYDLPDLPPLPLQYTDYSFWQRDWLRSEMLEELTEYWKDKLRRAPTVHSLPLDKVRPSNPSFLGGNVSFQIKTNDLIAFKGLCSENGATLFMGLYSVFSILLFRYSNESDILLGTPVAKRDIYELQNLIGFFVDTLVLRTSVKGESTFKDVLASNKKVVEDAFKNQYFPFDRVVEVVKPDRSLNHSPLFQIMLILQEAQGDGISFPGLELVGEKNLNVHTKYDLTLNVIEDENGLNVNWEYGADVFEHDTVKKMAENFVALFVELTRFPNKKINDIEFISEAERYKQVISWNDNKEDYGSDSQCIHDLFEIQVEKTPNAVAAKCGSEEVTYKELSERSSRLAKYLMCCREGSDRTLVGVCLERSIDMLVAILGVLKSGAAYLPLDKDLPSGRLDYLVNDSGVSTVITTSKIVSDRPILGECAVCIDKKAVLDALNIPASSGFNDEDTPSLSPGDLFYVIYTSGSEGHPKGVATSHRSILNRFFWMWKNYPFGDDEVCIFKTPIGFVDSIWEIFGGLLKGVPLVISNADQCRDIASLLALIKEHKVTRFVSVPSLLSSMLLNDSEVFQSHVASVRVWTCSGESLSPQVAKKFLSLCPRVKLLNIYGSTEVSADATFCEVSTSSHRRFSSIGNGLPNVSLYVLNSAMKLNPIGVVGELYIGGVGVTSGYWKRPELTREKFISNPFSNRQCDRLYRTGDLVSWLENGSLQYKGRIDNQAKINGVRIELGEIENVLLECNGVAESSVVLQEDGGAYIIAYARMDEASENMEDKAATKGEIRCFLKQKLPSYMVPSALVILESFPKNGSGKVDRKSLPKCNLSDVGEPYVGPETQLEETLCEIWQDVLKLEAVGVTQNFFELGGHSLLVNKLAILVREKLNVDVPLKTFFEMPNIRQLAESFEVLGYFNSFSFSEGGNDIEVFEL